MSPLISQQRSRNRARIYSWRGEKIGSKSVASGRRDFAARTEAAGSYAHEDSPG